MRVLVVCLVVALLLATVPPVHAQVIKSTWGYLKTRAETGPSTPPPPHRAGIWLYPVLLSFLTLP